MMINKGGGKRGGREGEKRNMCVRLTIMRVNDTFSSLLLGPWNATVTFRHVWNDEPGKLT